MSNYPDYQPTTYHIRVRNFDPINIISMKQDSASIFPYEFFYEVDAEVIGHNTTYKNATITSQCGDAGSTLKKMDTFSYALGSDKGRKSLEENIKQKVYDISIGLTFAEEFIEDSSYCILNAVRQAISEFSQMTFENPTVFEESTYADVNPVMKRLELVCQEQGVPLKLAEEKMNKDAIMLIIEVFDAESKENIYHESDDAIITVHEAKVDFVK